MADVPDKVVVPPWRAFKVAPVTIVIMGRHRESVPGVSLIERDLVPALELFVPAATALRVFDALRVVTLERHAQNLEELRRRTRFWLTYVRLDLPGYAASEMEGRSVSADVTIDRGRGLLDVASEYATGEAPHYMAQMLTEMGPLHDRCVVDRAAALASGLERQTLQREMRKALVPVSAGLVMLRLLLRNALGSTHADVRAIDIDPPSRRKKTEASAEAPAIAKPQTSEAAVSSEHTAPNTAQRMFNGQA